MKSIKHFICHLFYLGVSLTFLSTVTLAADSVKTSATQTQPYQDAQSIHYSDEQLTLDVKDISLAHLLQEIARQSGFTVLYNGLLDETITMQFEQLNLEEGLRKILQQHNFAIEYVQKKNEGELKTVLKPVKLWIYYKGGKSGPYKTLQTAMTGDVPGGQEDAGKIIADYEYNPEMIVREYKTKAVAKALLKENDSGILELSEAIGKEMSAEKVKAVIENALKDVDEEIKGELLEELDEMIEKIK